MKVIDRILRHEVKRNLGGLIIIAGLMLAVVGFDIIAPWPFKILIDNVLGTTPLGHPPWLGFLEPILSSRYLLGLLAALVYFMSTFLLSMVEYARDMATKKVTKRVTASFSKNAFQNLQTLSIGFYKDQEVGDYIYRLSYDVSAIGEFLEYGVLPLVTSLLYLLGTATIMLLIDVRLALLAFLILPFLAIGLFSFNSSIARATRWSEYFNSAAFSFIEEALTHLKIIQAFTQEHRESRRFDKKTEDSLGGDLRLYRLDFMLTLAIDLTIAICYSAIIILGIRAVFAGTLTTGLLIVFIFYLDNLTVPIQNMIYATTLIKQTYVKITRMQDFFDQKSHLEAHGTVNTINHTGIRFEDVSLQGDEGKGILHHVYFNIPEGKRTVIFGESGSGKSTVVNLMLRFIDKPSSGRIVLGGLPLNRYNVEALRTAIAFVPQEITLFNESILHNIQFGNAKSSFNEVVQAARQSAAHGFISKLPGRYRFRVGEGGSLLSGGQRQRLMLARALLKRNAKILLFDETLSALDIKTRLEVLYNLYEASSGRTTVLVSNIFDVARAADHVIVMDSGRVIYEGSARRLPQEASLYHMIIRNQHN